MYLFYGILFQELRDSCPGLFRICNFIGNDQEKTQYGFIIQVLVLAVFVFQFQGCREVFGTSLHIPFVERLYGFMRKRPYCLCLILAGFSLSCPDEPVEIYHVGHVLAGYLVGVGSGIFRKEFVKVIKPLFRKAVIFHTGVKICHDHNVLVRHIQTVYIGPECPEPAYRPQVTARGDGIIWRAGLRYFYCIRDFGITVKDGRCDIPKPYSGFIAFLYDSFEFRTEVSAEFQHRQRQHEIITVPACIIMK